VALTPDDAPVPIGPQVAEILGWTPNSWRRVQRGYTPTLRYVIGDGQRRAFVKVAVNRTTRNMVRLELAAYAAVGAEFRPALLGWRIDPQHPLLILEDLSDAHWPPPWRPPDVSATLRTIAALHASQATLPTHAELHRLRALPPGWAAVAEDPRWFLSLRLVTRKWLTAALPALCAAERDCSPEGDAPCHFDLRSDNIFVVDGIARFVDWGMARLANPRLDLGMWLPSLCFEGGPLPEEILPDAPEIAAWTSGFFAARAGQPPVPDAPLVRRVQREQLSTALPWVQRALGLPPLDGPRGTRALPAAPAGAG
jgi:hypothetical protein